MSASLYVNLRCCLRKLDDNLIIDFFSMETPLHKLHLKSCVMSQVFVALEKLLSKRKGTLSTYVCLHHWSDQRIWFKPIPTGGGPLWWYGQWYHKSYRCLHWAKVRLAEIHDFFTFNI